MSLVFSVPGKTFLAGEYLALVGGPALVFLSQPCFETVISPGRGDVRGIHPQSPAGLFMSKHRDYFKDFEVEFRDAYSGKGGFGASTAQFLSAYALWLYKETHQQDMEKILDFKHLLEAYYEVAWNGEGQRPSGADLVGQFKGSLTFFEKRQGLLSVKGWPFADIEFHLIHTGNKLATHEHLKNLPAFSADSLEQAFSIIKASFDNSHGGLFCEGVEAYARALKDLNFTCQPTLKLLQELRQLPGVRAAKGCGALGADVVLAVVSRGESESLKTYCEKQGLALLSSSDKISQGLQVRGSL